MRTVSVAVMRSMEAEAIRSGSDGYMLMRRAGEGAARRISSRFGTCSRAVVLAGGGNNGGDALVVAALLKLPVVVYGCRARNAFAGEAAQAAADLPQTVPFLEKEHFSPEDFLPGDVIIDGLLGIGYDGRPLREPYRSAIAAVNASGCPVAALDLPSGLLADSGAVSPDGAVQAAMTITFGAVKHGLVKGEGPRRCGELAVEPIGLTIPSGPDPDSVELYTELDAAKVCLPLAFDTYKNRRGSLLIVAGGRSYSGAAGLASMAALRAGAGMVRLATAAPRSGLPMALILRELPATEEGGLPPDTFARLNEECASSDALVAGPGWGHVSGELLTDALAFPGPVLLDADALNRAAAEPERWVKRSGVVITPHPGEAARLAAAFGLPEKLSREALAQELALCLNAVTVLKGPGTIVAASDGRWSRNGSGGPALATAGSGDVLSGTIGALLASGMEPYAAAQLGVFLHGAAGQGWTSGLIADDLPVRIGAVFAALREHRFSVLFH